MKVVRDINPRKWGICAIVILVVMIVGMALMTYIVDPYFHYHAPIQGMSYRLYEQRYINDGISRHFKYDAVVTGNSLSENVKASEVDDLFDCKSVKLPYSGAGYKELWESLERTLSYNAGIEKVIVFVDTEDITNDKDFVRYEEYPDYLYDNNIWNDASYLWNKDIFYRGTLYNLLMTLSGRESTTFDEYSAKDSEMGPEVVLPLIGDIPEPEDANERQYTEEDRQNVEENIKDNIVRVVEKYPEVDFYLIFCPPSIARWGKYYRWGEVQYRIAAGETATGLLLNEKNIHLYGFQDDLEVVCNLDNYRDTIHYSSDIASYIIKTVSEGKRELTTENSGDYFLRLTDFFVDYNYQSLRVEEFFANS